MISPTMQGKRITVYVNGDPFMKGKQITLNTHQFPQFDKFCDFLTDTVPNRTGGCYRRVYTPNGSEIRALDQIEAGCEYVASKDRYKRVSKEYTYREIPEKTRIPRHKGFKKIDINKVYTPVQHAIEERLRKKSGRSFYLNEHVRGLILRVHTNGCNERPACPVAIRSKDRENMNKIKESIETTMNLNPIVRMFNIINCGGYEENFVEIHDCSELEQNGHILVLTKNETRIKPIFYSMSGKTNFSVATSPRSGQYYLYPSFPPEPRLDSKQYKHNQSLNKHKPLPSIGSSSKQSDAVSPFSNPPSQHGRGGRRSKGKAQNVDYDRDDAGVYRAKGQNHGRGAQQVNDTYETHTERPIDQMEAEEVDEERTSEEQAATRIQAGARGYKVRKEHRQRMEAAQREQAEHETEVGGRRSVEDDLYRRQDAAATKIQAGYKGYKTRKEMNTKKAQVSEGEILDKPRSDNYAAAKIQAGYRGYKTRKEYNAKRTFSKHGEPEKEASEYRKGDEDIAKEKAAMKIQAGYRGYKTRKVYSSRKEAKKVVNDLMANERQDEILYSENQERAATKIQAGFRGHRARKEYSVKREAKQKEERQMDDAATKIQAGFKGYQTRKNVAKEKQAHLKEESAATKIQAGYRGYKTRKEIKSKGQK